MDTLRVEAFFHSSFATPKMLAIFESGDGGLSGFNANVRHMLSVQARQRHVDFGAPTCRIANGDGVRRAGTEEKERLRVHADRETGSPGERTAT